MPGFMTHYILGIKLYQEIPENKLKESIHSHKNLFRLGLQGPDFLFVHPRAAIGKKGKHIGSRIHEEQVNEFFRMMLYQAEEEQNSLKKEMAIAYISGFVCHYIFDSTMHPYIYDTAGFDPYEPNSSAVSGAHAHLETLLDTWLIQYYKGRKSFKVRKAAIVVQLSLKEANFLIRFLSDSINRTYYRGGEEKYGTTEKFVKNALILYRITCDLFHDTTGRKRKILEGVERYTWKYPLVSSLIYPGREPDKDEIMNLSHREWFNPWDRSVVSTESLFDLYKKSNDLGRKIFAAFEEYLEPFYEGKCLDKEREKLLETIGDRSYHSGLKCEPPQE